MENSQQYSFVCVYYIFKTFDGKRLHLFFCFRLVEESEDPLSRRSQKNRQAEQELHEMSEKLARRLEELDLVSVLKVSEAVTSHICPVVNQKTILLSVCTFTILSHSCRC